ncbi:MAG: hypothetical protein GDA46_02500 [Bdellovibrionales bacterium]|nr:hypothetical protein [Bdellovibrionales bacterium]
MFFKLQMKFFVIFLAFSPLKLFAEKGDFSFLSLIGESKCVKYINHYYPHFINGNLNQEGQDKWFRCLWSFLDAVVNKKILIHDSSRDHFTREEIFNLFHKLFEYGKVKSNRLTNQLLFIKKLLVGGSIDKLRDQELSHLFHLIHDENGSNDYRLAYFIIHKEIPTLRKLFRGEIVREKARDKALEQLRKTLIILERAYKRVQVSYSIEDISQYPKYMGMKDSKLQSLFLYLHHLLRGSVFPKKAIEGKDWSVFNHLILGNFELLFYINKYFNKKNNTIQITYNSLSVLEKFMELLSSNENLFLKRGFPVRNLDGILKASFSLIKSFVTSSNPLFSLFDDETKISLITRVLTCFSLNEKGKKECSIDWMTNDSSLVKISFPDSEFSFFKNYIQRKDKKTTYFISSKKIEKLKDWTISYRIDLFQIYDDFEKSVAIQRQFDHWLKNFFGWNEKKQMIFGNVQNLADNKFKTTHLLAYHSILSLLLSYHVPKAYFLGKTDLKLQQWQSLLSDLTPLFFTFLDEGGYNLSWRDIAGNMFSIADLFLNSSDLSDTLSSRELLDLVIHLDASFQQAQKISSLISSICSSNNFLSCTVKTIIDHPEGLAPFPLLKRYITDFRRKKYEDNMKRLLFGLQKNKNSSLLLTELFFLLQVMEVNYYQRINTDLIFNLETHELLAFSDQFKERVYKQIPYIYNEDQGLSYIMYVFRTGSFPFFTGSEFETILFSNWYLKKRHKKDFEVSPSRFHNLVFDLHHLYKKYW